MTAAPGASAGRPRFFVPWERFAAENAWAVAAVIAAAVLIVSGWFYEPCLDVLVVVPLIAAVGSTPWATAWVGFSVLAGVFLLGLPNGIWLTRGHWSEILANVLTCFFAVFIAFMRQRSKRVLHASERQLRAAFDDALDAMVLADDEGRYVDANPAACALFGRAHGELIGLSAADVSPPELHTADAWRHFRSAGRLRGEWTVLRPDGTARQLEFNGTADILPGRHLAVIRDVTDRKRSEEALRESEERFRAVFEGAGDALLIFDDAARVVDVNAAGCEMYGRPRKMILGQRIEDLRTAAYDFKDVWTEFLRVGHARGEFRVPRPDGTVRDVEFFATARFLPGRHLTIQRDVTQRRRAERNGQVFSELGLKLSSAQTAAEAARVIAGCADELWHWDACTVDGYSADSDRVDPLLTMDVIAGERQSVPPARVNAPPSPTNRRVLRDGAQIVLREEPVTASDSIPFGDTARFSRSILIAPIRAGASVVGFISVHSYEPNAYDERDLESLQALANLCSGAFVRTRIFEELRRGEQKLREAQAIGRIAVWERDLRDDSVLWSKEMYEFFGLDPLTFRPTVETFLQRVVPEDRAAVAKMREDAVRERRAFQQEYRIRKEDGSVAFIQGRGEVILDEAGDPVRLVGVSQDITEQRRAEEQLRRSYEEMQALSRRLGAVREEESARLAREVHDEVGQALTALKFDLAWVDKRLARARRSGDTDLRPKLAAMEGLIDTTLDAVQRIATDLRPGVLNELGLEAAVAWYAQEFEKRTEIACHFHSEMAGTFLDDSRSTAAFRILQEILTNVARHSGATKVRIALGRENGSLVLEARDNGKGIRADQISDSRSLGLVGMRERARSFGGSVEIRGRSGRGTAVTVSIPL